MIKNKSIKVLLVDDNEATNNYNKRLIMSMGLSEDIHSEINGQKGLDYILNCKDEYLPAVIFLDINMPVLDGFGFLLGYRSLDESKRKSIIVLMLTTSILEDDKVKCNAIKDIKEYLSKPLNKLTLREIWNKYFD